MTWQYHKKFSGQCGFGEGFIEVKEGVLTTPEKELTAEQKRRLEESPKWSRVSPPSKPKQSASSSDLGADQSLFSGVVEEPPAALPVEEEKPKPKRKRAPRKKSTAKKSEG